MKCVALNVRATFGMITRKWKSAMLTVIGPPLANTMTMKRRTKSNAERKGSFSPSPFSGKYLDVKRLIKCCLTTTPSLPSLYLLFLQGKNKVKSHQKSQPHYN